MSETETTTLTVSVKTRNRLADMGRKDETFEDIITKLLEEHDNNERAAGSLERARGLGRR